MGADLTNMPTCSSCTNAYEVGARFCPSCGLRIVETPKPGGDPWIGRSLPGGYVILEKIGDGGMGKVYRAEQSKLGRTVAVKIVHPHLLNDETVSARFITEARAASRLNHPNSLAVFDFGKTDSGQLYLVMEHLRGKDLARLVTDEGQLPLVRVIDILRQLLDAVSEAHQLGIVHRDLKPDNIIIESLRTGGDFVKVVDFGLAKILTSLESPAVTAEGTVCGTPDYLAPELCRGGSPEPRTDLYAIGIVLFLLLTGHLPFEAPSATQVLLRHLGDPVPDPREVCPERDIPEILAEICMKAMAKDPVMRFQSAQEFADALAEARARLEGDMPRSSVLPSAAAAHCTVCGSPIPFGQKFCGECGARATPSKPGRVSSATSPTPPSVVAETDVMPIVAFPLPLTARESEHAWLLDRLERASSRLVLARLVGDAGVGKTRLLQEFAQTAESDAHVVVAVGPDPWLCGASYHALRVAIRALASLQEAGDQQWAWDGAPPEAEWGLSTVLAPDSARGPSALSPRHRRNAAAAALRWALMKAAQRAEDRPIVLVIDDLDLVDGASRNAFADVLASPEQCTGLVVGAHGPGFSPGWPGTCPTRIVSGLSREDVARMLEGTKAAALLREVEARALAPLYVEHLARFAAEGGTMPPQRLGDLIALRIALLGTGQRRVLQAVAVLGRRSPITWIARLLGDPTDVARYTRDLVRAGFVGASDQGVEVTHRLVREIVDAGTPVEARRELHAAAAELLSGDSTPLEARARFYLGAEDAFEALLLLDRVGTRSLERADVGGAIEAYGRALAFARAQIGRPDFDDQTHAAMVFTRKLADALVLAGRTSEADEVLRDTLASSGMEPERARLLYALANVSRAQSRDGDARSYLREAISEAQRLGASDLVYMFQETARDWAR